MRALVQTATERFAIRDVPYPEPGAGEVLVRVEASGICGSDMHAFLGHDDRRPAPIVLGHEAAGTIKATGQRVTINPLVICSTCAACTGGRDNLCVDRQIISMPPRAGAFAQYVAMPERNLVPVPDRMSFRQAALAEPIACGWHAVRVARSALGGSLDGVSAVVIGGGAIGVGAALSLRAQGATDVTVIEPNAVRQDYLAPIDAFRTVSPDDAPSAGSASLVVDAVGYVATRADACRYAAPGGIIVHIGLGEAEGGLDVRRMTLQEIAFIGTYTYTAPDFRDTVQAMIDGHLGPLDWTETRPMADGANAFADIRAGVVPAPKIILEPQAQTQGTPS